ncbi:hypothetical protein [Streptomyces atriruber]|uniref:hypothetical protein n=1 Tax=Streptomyces atriruber TaxID=545121 RepID=UPI000AAB447B|nr:hypothetical protein [Streptomyces atriruber]
MLPRLFVRNLLYVLLLAAVLVCSGGHHHGQEGPHAPSTFQVADAPASPGHCHELGSGPGSGSGSGSVAQSFVRLLALVPTTAPVVHAVRASAARPLGVARGRDPGGGRAALNSLCRWRI